MRLLTIALAALPIFITPLQGNCQPSMIFTVTTTGDDDDPNAGGPGRKCDGSPGETPGRTFLPYSQTQHQKN